jgi:DNA-binding response OmpR family regulator
MEECAQRRFDLVILDCMMHDMRGEESLRGLRDSTTGYMPVLFITYSSGDLGIKSMSSMRAHDYLLKPVAPGVLVTRVEALGRSVRRTSPVTTEVYGDYEFDTMAENVVVKGRVVTLTHKEFELAMLFFRNLNRSLAREDILNRVWRRMSDISSRTLDTHVSVLRTKLGLVPDTGYLLTSVYGYGFRLEQIEAMRLTAQARTQERRQADPLDAS